MARKEMDAKRSDSRLCPSGEGVVLLQRPYSEGPLRENDPSRNAGRGSLVDATGSGKGKAGLVASLTVNELTSGEVLLIARRRSGESQETVARRLGTTRNVYGRLERDEEENFKVPIPKLEELTDAERCLILRRRAGMTQEDCAEEIGVTRFWFNQMEMGKVSVSDLVKFWEQRV